MSMAFKYLNPADLPKEWTADHFGNLVDFNLGRTPPRASPIYWKEGKYPWVSISDMTPNGVITDTAEKVSQQAHDSIFRGKLVPEGSLLMSFKLTIGRMSRLGIPAFHNEAIISFQPNSDEISPEYLSYYLSQINFKDYQDTAIKGQTLNKGKLNSLEIALPPLPEQKKIAHILSTVQLAMEAQERIIQTTTELKKALMHKLFTEGLCNEPQKQTEIGLVPESWDVVKLSEIAKIERGKFSHRPRNEPRFYGGEYPFVQTGDVSNCDGYIRSYTQTLNKDGLAISKMFPAGTILITIAANIGFTGILEFDSACPDSLIGITPNENVHTEFLNYYLITQQPEMDRIAPKGTQKNINIQFLKPWPIPLPSIEEQIQIAGAFSATDRKIRLATKKRAQLQDLFRTLLHELMTAKSRVHELEREKGEVA